jgi:hypothetical protein
VKTCDGWVVVNKQGEWTWYIGPLRKMVIADATRHMTWAQMRSYGYRAVKAKVTVVPK